jgi:hypothetical protein
MPQTALVHADPRIGTIIDGHRIEERLSSGGMGVVYRARHLRLNREVALKLILPHLVDDPKSRRRFDREMELAASIDHEHVVSVHGAAETPDGDVYLTMQLVDGKDLRQVLDEGGPEDPLRATELLAQIAGALDAAHARGLVHRDVKPGNILIGRRNGRPHAYLTDFGLAKRIASAARLTDSAAWVGTIDYAAPEQIFGPAVDARTDVYALGCVLYDLLTDRVPFPQEDVWAKAHAHASAPRPKIADAAPVAIEPANRAAFDAVIARAMAIEPSARYQSAGDLGRAAVAAARGLVAPAPEGSVARGEAAPSQPGAQSARAAAVATEAGASDGRARRGQTTRSQRWLVPTTDRRTADGASGSGRRRRFAQALAVALVASATCAAGFALAFDGGSPTGSASGLRLSNASIELRVPADWRPSDLPRIPGISFADPLFAASPRGATRMTVVAGLVEATGSTLLPDTLVVEGRQPTSDAVLLGKLHALRYRGVRVHGVAGPMSVYVAPTDRGVATVVCMRASAPARQSTDRCDAVAATLRLRVGRAFAVGPRRAYADALNRITRRLSAARLGMGRTLFDAESAAGQARTAGRIAVAYGQAGASVAAVGPSPADAAANSRLRAELLGARDAYARLSQAAGRGASDAYLSARESIARRLRGVDAALARLEKDGYDVR